MDGCRIREKGGVNKMSKIKNVLAEKRELIILLVIIVLSAALSMSSRTFLTSQNLISVLLSVSLNIIMAVGMVNLMVSGGFDMSIGSIFGLAGGVCAYVMKSGIPIPISILIGLLVGLVIGLFNGYSVAKLGISAFVTTLATQQMGRGLLMVLLNGQNISSLSDKFTWLGQKRLAGVQLPIIYAVIIVVVGAILLSKSRFFRQNYYVGGNEKAARLCGINVDRMTIINYGIMGLLAALAGIVMTARVATASTTAGDGLEMKVITAVIIGGASLKGGEGTVFGAVLGCILMGVISNAMTLLNVNVYWQTFVTGFTLFIAVLIDVLGNAQKNKSRG